MTDLKTGLTLDEVKERIVRGEKNDFEFNITKSYRQIVHDNICTLFNLINLILGVLILCTGSYQNLLFLSIVLANISIGMLQEVRSKRMLDKVSLLEEAKVNVLRDQEVQTISKADIVRDDIMLIKSGQQLVADAIVCEGMVEVDESMLSGESDTICKRCGDQLLSGSIIMSGEAHAQVIHVGKENYINQLSVQAKTYQKHPSQLRDSMNKILRYIGILLIPMGLAMFAKELIITKSSITDALLQTSASIIAMIPEGLFFLTSISLAAGVIHLLMKKTMVQELYCIESLARVDTLCLDKTGTITCGTMSVDQIIPLDDTCQVIEILRNLISVSIDHNATMEALRKHIDAKQSYELIERIPFSSERKYSAALFKEGYFAIGAYEFLNMKDARCADMIQTYASRGYRTLVLGFALDRKQPLKAGAIILLKDRVREDAKEIFYYFKQQNVDIKIISGDDPRTVMAAACDAGISTHAYIDVSKLNDEELKQAVMKYQIFGRVSPQQKKLMVKALKAQGKTVAMSGDGVNDVLAFKEADCSIAMASGSEAAKHIANIVLLVSDFKAMPQILFEGRRVINNIERASSLFLTKTIYSILLALIVMISGIAYPFVPIHLTFISIFTIGIPSFFLALQPNHDQVKGQFIFNVLKRSIPGAIAVILCIIIGIIFQDYFAIKGDLSIYALLCISINGLLVLYQAMKPFNPFKIILFLFCFLSLGLGFFLFPDLLMIDVISLRNFIFFTSSILLIQLPVYAIMKQLMETFAHSTQSDMILKFLKNEA